MSNKIIKNWFLIFPLQMRIFLYCPKVDKNYKNLFIYSCVCFFTVSNQTVNLLSLTSVVRIHLPPPIERRLCLRSIFFCPQYSPHGFSGWTGESGTGWLAWNSLRPVCLLPSFPCGFCLSPGQVPCQRGNIITRILLSQE